MDNSLYCECESMTPVNLFFRQIVKGGSMIQADPGSRSLKSDPGICFRDLPSYIRPSLATYLEIHQGANPNMMTLPEVVKGAIPAHVLEKKLSNTCTRYLRIKYMHRCQFIYFWGGPRPPMLSSAPQWCSRPPPPITVIKLIDFGGKCHPMADNFFSQF